MQNSQIEELMIYAERRKIIARQANSWHRCGAQVNHDARNCCAPLLLPMQIRGAATNRRVAPASKQAASRSHRKVISGRICF